MLLWAYFLMLILTRDLDFGQWFVMEQSCVQIWRRWDVRIICLKCPDPDWIWNFHRNENLESIAKWTIIPYLLGSVSIGEHPTLLLSLFVFLELVCRLSLLTFRVILLFIFASLRSPIVSLTPLNKLNRFLRQDLGNYKLNVVNIQTFS